MIIGHNLRLRHFSKSDLDESIKMLEDPVIAGTLWRGLPLPRQREESEAWLKTLRNDGSGPMALTIERLADDAFMGSCGFMELDVKNRVGTLWIWVGTPYQGHGYGTEAMRLLVDFAFLEMNLHKVRLFVFSNNPGARHVYEKIGFKLEGTLREEIYRNGVYHDQHAMGLLRSEWEARRAELSS